MGNNVFHHHHSTRNKGAQNQEQHLGVECRPLFIVAQEFSMASNHRHTFQSTFRNTVLNRIKAERIFRMLFGEPNPWKNKGDL
jgi:hypothetical protein